MNSLPNLFTKFDDTDASTKKSSIEIEEEKKDIIDYKAMAAAMANAQINVSTEFDAYSSRNNTSYNGVAQAGARFDSGFQ